MTTHFKTRLFIILFLLGMPGVLSFLLVDLSALAALAPVQPGANVPKITPLIKILSVIQPTVLLAAAVLAGVALANTVGLSAPVAESLATGNRSLPTLKFQLAPGLVGGVIGALGIVLSSAIFTPFLMAQTVERIHNIFELIPFPTRLLYGGITEELLMRWGLMTFVVWILLRVLRKGAGQPTTTHFILAILISSIVFAIAHLPTLVLLGETSIPLVLFVIVANSLFGFIAGYLYWKYGLESAIIAHIVCHIVLALANYAGAYF